MTMKRVVLLLTVVTIVAVVSSVLVWMGDFKEVFISVVGGGAGLLAFAIIGANWNKLPPHWRDGSWREGVMVVLGLLLAVGSSMLVTHVLESMFHHDSHVLRKLPNLKRLPKL